ncbi:DUF86 domain-containing protein [Candidatus Pacearchaeota archaeon]|nr:DUF86 domain-containing protein [Candidatus Pacearchaeota archaeon]
MIKKRDLRKKEIESKLNDILESISIIEENLPDNVEEFLSLGLVKEGIYKKLEFAIESILDIGNIINSDLRLGVPEAEEDILKNLESKEILDKGIINLIREMKKFRNILIHKYGKIDDKKAFEEITEGLNDFGKIIQAIEGFLKKHKS